jgi:hypothetical protein
MTWRAKKDAPTDGTPIIIWSIFGETGGTGLLFGARFGEIEVDGETITGWFNFDPLNVEYEGWGSLELDENKDDFLWIPFPQWELAENLGKALVRAHKAKNKPPSEDSEE